MKENPRLKKATEEAEALKGEPLNELELFRLYLAQFMKDRQDGLLDEYDEEEIERLSEFLGRVVHDALDDEVTTILEDQGAHEKKYRTRSDARKAGAINKMPTALAVPTLKEYKYAMSLYQDDKSKAYLQLFSTTDK